MKSAMSRIVLAVLLMSAGIASARAAPAFFVVLASFHADAGPVIFESAERAKRIAAGCGVAAWTEYTSKIAGFRPGYFTVILGPFATRAVAEAERLRVLPCVPGAYVKAGGVPGE